MGRFHRRDRPVRRSVLSYFCERSAAHRSAAAPVPRGGQPCARACGSDGRAARRHALRRVRRGGRRRLHSPDHQRGHHPRCLCLHGQCQLNSRGAHLVPSEPQGSEHGGRHGLFLVPGGHPPGLRKPGSGHQRARPGRGGVRAQHTEFFPGRIQGRYAVQTRRVQHIRPGRRWVCAGRRGGRDRAQAARARPGRW